MSVYTITSATLTRQVTWSATMTRRKITFAAILGSLLGLSGIALAAFLLSATVTGSTSYADSTGGITVVDVTGTKGATVNCTDSTKTGENAFRVVAVVKRVNGAVQAGSCNLTVKLSNQGDTAVKITDGRIELPTGWTATNLAGPQTIPAGGTVSYSATLNAGENAVAAPINGSITGALAG